MPSHIFTRVGYWKESIASNTASAKAAKAGKEFARAILHAMDYMVYAYLQLGQDGDARAGHRRDAASIRLQAPAVSLAPITRWRPRRRAMWWNAATGTVRRELQVRAERVRRRRWR